MTQKELTVLMVEPGRHPKVTKLKDDLDSLQKAVCIGADYQALLRLQFLQSKHVGRWSAEGECDTLLTDDMDFMTDFVRNLQVPPRAPKRQSKGCLFFCQSIVAKTAKTPVFPTKPETQGIFCSFQAILIHLQLFPPILVALAAQGCRLLVINDVLIIRRDRMGLQYIHY